MKKNKKLIPLDKFINEALYKKKNGYYMKNISFDKKGDFITSPNISILFSEIITIWIVMYWEYIGKPKNFNLIELGAGNGEMMLQIMKTSKKFPTFYQSTNNYIFEKSNFLKNTQKKNLKDFKVNWIRDIQNIKNKEKSLFIGNEFLDAFPIKQFKKIKNKWYENYVEEVNQKRSVKSVKVNLKKYYKLVNFNFVNNQKFIEISPEQISFIKKLISYLIKTKSAVLFIDYGYQKKEMFNTLQGIKNHKKTNFLKHKGSTDITHLINFNFLKKFFTKYGLIVNGVTSQGNFLKEMGIFDRAEIIAKNLSFKEKINIFYRIKRLTHPHEMGDLFKFFFASHKSIKFKKGFIK